MFQAAENILLIFLWTLLLWSMHFLSHHTQFLWKFHLAHHEEVLNGIGNPDWRNLFLWFNTFEVTMDQWLIEVIPTLVLAYAFNAYWLIMFYYVWAACIQESIRHNPEFNLMPFLVSGKYHLIHHRNSSKNFGVYTPIWDMLLGTYEWKNTI